MMDRTGLGRRKARRDSMVWFGGCDCGGDDDGKKSDYLYARSFGSLVHLI